MLHSPDSKTVVPIVVVLRVNSTAVEVQVPSVTSTVPRRRPVVAVRATVVAGSTRSVAGAGEELLNCLKKNGCVNDGAVATYTASQRNATSQSKPFLFLIFNEDKTHNL